MNEHIRNTKRGTSPNHALQRALFANRACSPRAEEQYARASLGGHSCGAAERGR